MIQEGILEQVMDQVAFALDIPPHQYQLAMDRFDSIRRHLEQGDYPESAPPPEIYPQGSFRLGTVIRPIRDGKETEFDLDIVCQINRRKDRDSPATLKQQVGAEVMAYAESKGMQKPDNSRRCWALNYAPDKEDVGFHVDILPCLPDPAAGAQISVLNASMGATAESFSRTTVAITNRDDQATPPIHSWRSSNPKGFATWFENICEPGFNQAEGLRQKQLLFEAYGNRQNFPFRQATDIPNALVRTPLQRAIQIMKRHRDMRFNRHKDERHSPISMIITSLAARLFEGQANKYRTTQSVLRYIVDTLAQHADLIKGIALREDVQRRQLIRRVGNHWYIPNPVNPHNPGDALDKGENFADRWHEDNHAKAKAFFQWVTWLRDDLDLLLSSNDLAEVKGAIAEAFGDSIADRALRVMENRAISPSASSGILGIGTPAQFNASHCDKPNWPARLSYQVTIDARATRSSWRTLLSRIGFKRISKQYSLRFEAKTNAPDPYEVYWQVVNTGDEASKCGQLRGSIFSGDRIHHETTGYTGFHWIECFIVKDKVLVARSGRFVVNIN